MKILVIQTAFLGDIVLTTPLFSALRERWPDCEINVITTPSGAEVLAGIPLLFAHSIDKKKLGFWGSLKDVKKKFQSEHFDIVFCVHRSLRSLLMGRIVNAEIRIGFRTLFSKILGYNTTKYPSYSDDIHYVEKPLFLLKVIGFSQMKKKRPNLVLREVDESSLAAKIKQKEYICISPFSVWGTKMWPSEKFSEVASRFSKETGLGVVIAGSGDRNENNVAEEIVRRVKATGGVAVNLVNQTSVGEFKTLLANSKIVLSNDSAAVHIAAAFDVPIVAVFGPTVKKWGFFPLSSRSKVVEINSLDCRPCSLHGPVTCPKKHFRCMNDITVEAVLEALRLICAAEIH